MPGLSRFRKPVVRGMVAVLVVLGVVMGLLTLFQRQLIYFPDSTPVPSVTEVADGGRDVRLRTSDGLELGAWFLPADAGSNRDMAVLVAPGNGGNRAGRLGLAAGLAARGFAVLLMDYRGYGGNPGKPSEDGLARDATAAAAALEELGYPPDRTIYFGESLGTGVVAALQSRRTPAGVVLRSPFPALADVGSHHYPWLPVRLLLKDEFPVTRHLSDTEVPVSVIYGDSDSVVPTELSARVADGAPSLLERLVIRGADHNDEVMFGPRVAEAVARMADHVG